jgi:hypothetical protein
MELFALPPLSGPEKRIQLGIDLERTHEEIETLRAEAWAGPSGSRMNEIQGRLFELAHRVAAIRSQGRSLEEIDARRAQG